MLRKIMLISIVKDNGTFWFFFKERYSPLSFVSFEIYNGFSLVRWKQTIKGQLFKWAEVSNVLYISLKYFFQIQVVYGYSLPQGSINFQWTVGIV